MCVPQTGSEGTPARSSDPEKAQTSCPSLGPHNLRTNTRTHTRTQVLTCAHAQVTLRSRQVRGPQSELLNAALILEFSTNATLFPAPAVCPLPSGCLKCGCGWEVGTQDANHNFPDFAKRLDLGPFPGALAERDRSQLWGPGGAELGDRAPQSSLPGRSTPRPPCSRSRCLLPDTCCQGPPEHRPRLSTDASAVGFAVVRTSAWSSPRSRHPRSQL